MTTYTITISSAGTIAETGTADTSDACDIVNNYASTVTFTCPTTLFSPSIGSGSALASQTTSLTFGTTTGDQKIKFTVPPTSVIIDVTVDVGTGPTDD